MSNIIPFSGSNSSPRQGTQTLALTPLTEGEEFLLNYACERAGFANRADFLGAVIQSAIRGDIREHQFRLKPMSAPSSKSRRQAKKGVGA